MEQQSEVIQEISRYQSGKIYKIISELTNKIYIGSTCAPTLAHRLAQHKYKYKHFLKNQKNPVASYDLLKMGPVEIVLIELYPCNSMDELSSREKYHVQQNIECVVNKYLVSNIPSSDYYKNYYQVNKEKIYKKYYQDHKDEIIERAKQSRNKMIAEDAERYKQMRKEWNKKAYQIKKQKVLNLEN